MVNFILPGTYGAMLLPLSAKASALSPHSTERALIKAISLLSAVIEPSQSSLYYPLTTLNAVGMSPFLIPPSLSPTSSGYAFPDPSQAPLPLPLASAPLSSLPSLSLDKHAGLWPGIHDHLNASDSQFSLLNYVFTGHLPGNMAILANSLAPN